MSNEEEAKLAVAVADMRGDIRGMREVFAAHTVQDMEQFTSLNTTLKDLDTKVDQLLIREAHRSGEVSGIRRSVVLMAGGISVAVSILGLAVQAFVG